MSFSDALNSPNDPLSRFDAAAGADDALAAFDRADGTTHIPAGWYGCTVACGELVPTKAGKTAYRLSFDVADGPHRGFRLWRYYMLDTLTAANRAKLALAAFGLRTSADLRRPFPGPGRTVTVRVLVGVQTRPGNPPSNDVERFEVVSDVTAPPNPHAIDPDRVADEAGEGGAT